MDTLALRIQAAASRYEKGYSRNSEDPRVLVISRENKLFLVDSRRGFRICMHSGEFSNDPTALTENDVAEIIVNDGEQVWYSVSELVDDAKATQIESPR